MRTSAKVRRKIRPVQLTRGNYRIIEKIFLKSLSNSKKKTLQKLNPFRSERDALIRCLARRGGGKRSWHGSADFLQSKFFVLFMGLF